MNGNLYLDFRLAKVTQEGISRQGHELRECVMLVDHLYQQLESIGEASLVSSNGGGELLVFFSHDGGYKVMSNGVLLLGYSSVLYPLENWSK